MTALRLINGSKKEPPSFEATAQERASISRFIQFAIDDLKYQFDELNHDPRQTRPDLLNAQHAAVLIRNYLEKLRVGIDQMALKEMLETPHDPDSA